MLNFNFAAVCSTFVWECLTKMLVLDAIYFRRLL